MKFPKAFRALIFFDLKVSFIINSGFWWKWPCMGIPILYFSELKNFVLSVTCILQSKSIWNSSSTAPSAQCLHSYLLFGCYSIFLFQFRVCDYLFGVCLSLSGVQSCQCWDIPQICECLIFVRNVSLPGLFFSDEMNDCDDISVSLVLMHFTSVVSFERSLFSISCSFQIWPIPMLSSVLIIYLINLSFLTEYNFSLS